MSLQNDKTPSVRRHGTALGEEKVREKRKRSGSGCGVGPAKGQQVRIDAGLIGNEDVVAVTAIADDEDQLEVAFRVGFCPFKGWRKVWVRKARVVEEVA